MMLKSRIAFVVLSFILCASMAMAQAGINITYPSGAAGVCNVTSSTYGATGNGTTDDTAAIQAALLDSSCNYVYLPNGTYRITGALQWPYVTVHYGSIWLIGQTQTGTHLKLDNNLFTNVGSPTTILNVCGDSTHGGCASDSNYFNVGIKNLTLNTGSGNPGVVGIDFYASNIGAVRDVTVTSADGSGVYGFSLDASSANGPLLVKNLTVNGFQTGVEASIGQVDSATLEHITVNNQTVTGMNVNGTVSLRDLESNQGAANTGIPGTNGYGGQRVPALTQGGGFLTMIDSVLSGGSSGNSAISSIAGDDVLVRNTTSSGYGYALTDGSTSLTSPITEWTNDTVYDPFGGTGKTLGLTISETPAATWDDQSTWDVVMASGGDDTANIQAALNSGATTVCLCGGGAYNISSTLSVGGSVYHVIMVPGAYINELPGDGLYPLPVGIFNGPVFQMAFSGPSTVVFEQIQAISGSDTPMEINPSSRTMVVLDGTGNVAQSGTGSTYIEDLSGNLTLSGGSAWARQLNPEVGPNGTATLPLVTNSGGNLWILGQKQEGGAVTIQATGGNTELLGGLMYDCCGAGTSEFVVSNGQFSARIDEANYGWGGPWWTNFVQDTENGTTDYVTDGGSTGGVLGLYTNSNGSGSVTPSAPVAAAASSITNTITVTTTSSGFTANWAPSSGATGYYLDVSTDSSFGSFVSGYNNLNVGTFTSYAVSGLSASPTYYYRVRASNSVGTSGNSNTITVAVTTYVPLIPVVTVTPAASTSDSGSSLNVTGTVTGTGATPTGTVTLSGGGYTSAAVGLLSGSYSITIPANSLSAGTDTLTVSYSGDINYTTATGTANVTVTESVFTLAASTPAAIPPGGAAISAVTVSSTTGYAGTVTLSCALTTSPSGATDLPTCSFFDGSTVTLASGSTTGTPTPTVTVNTTAAYGELVWPKLGNGNGKGWAGAGGGAVLAFLVFLGIPARRRSWRSMLGVLVVMAALGSVAGCGGGGGPSNWTTPGNYTFTVTGTGNPAVTPVPTTTFTVTVN